MRRTSENQLANSINSRRQDGQKMIGTMLNDVTCGATNMRVESNSPNDPTNQ